MKGSPAWGSLKVARPSQVWRRSKDRQRGRERRRVASLKLNGLGCYRVKPEDKCGCVVWFTVNSGELFVRCSRGNSDFHGHIIGLN